MSHEDPAVVFDLQYNGAVPFIVCGLPMLEKYPDLERIYGCGKSIRRQIIAYPGYYPTLEVVLEDIDIVFDGAARFTPALRSYLDEIEARKEQGIPADFNFITKPYTHQRNCVARAYYQDRIMFALDMGLGKSKVAVDVLRLDRHIGRTGKVLIVCPPHLTENWRNELSVHAAGEFSVLSMSDHNTKTLPVARRQDMWRGALLPKQPASRYAETLPHLDYEPLDVQMSRIRWLEDAYVQAALSGDQSARRSARRLLIKRLKEIGHSGKVNTLRIRNQPDYVKDHDVIICSYGTLVADLEQILEQGFQSIVFDESHLLRSPTSQTSKTALKASRDMVRRIELTGTPTGGDPRHLYTPLRILCPALTDNYYAFSKRYLIKGTTAANDKMVFGFKNLHILSEIVSDVAVCMKTQDCVDLDLPALNVIDWPVTPDDTMRSAYNALLEDGELAVGEDGLYATPVHAADRSIKLRQILSGFVKPTPRDACFECPRLFDCVAEDQRPYKEGCVLFGEPEPVVDPVDLYAPFKDNPRLRHLEGLLDGIFEQEDAKCIIWCSFLHEIELISQLLDSRGIYYAKVTGSTASPPKQRERFNNDSRCRVYLSISSISAGFNLVSSQYTIYYSLPYDYIDYMQSMKRNHRIGQNNPVTAYRFYVPGSVGEGVLHLLSSKRQVADTATESYRCGVCPNVSTCRKDNILPFDPGCVYDREVRRKSLPPKKL